MKQVGSGNREPVWATIGVTVGISVAISSPTLAQQIIPDDTLPTPSSITPGCTVCTIEGGTLRGNNLFHSFTEFSVPTGGEAIYNNLATVEHIFSRVTGNSISDIDGLIQTNGTADLFLLNPNGIIFGPNAQLNLGGSFVASTANAIQFGDGSIFSALEPTEPLPLITIDPSAFLFNQITSRQINPIEVQGVLEVSAGQSLILLGDDASSTNDSNEGLLINGGALLAPSGYVGLLATSNPGKVELGFDQNLINIRLLPTSTPSDITLTNQALVNTSGESGGIIQVYGRGLTLTDGSIIAANVSGSGDGGRLIINVSESVQLAGESEDGQLVSALLARNAGAGTSATLNITTRDLIVRDGAQISTSTLGNGPGGNIVINSSESVQVVGTTSDEFFPSAIFATTEGPEDAGNIDVNTRRLTISGGAEISTFSLDEGNAGAITINASELVQVMGASLNNITNSGVYSSTFFGSGNAGNLIISTEDLIVGDGAQISSGTFSEGIGGTLLVNASGSIQVSGISEDGLFGSGLFTQAEGPGNAGEMVVITGQLVIREGGRVSSATFREGAGGKLTVNASEFVQVTGTSSNGQTPSGLLTRSEGSGAAGELEIMAPLLLVQDRGEISASNSDGKANNILVSANILETSDGGRLITTTTGREDAGNLILFVDDRIASTGAGSGLFANAEQGASGNGGDILVRTPRIISLQEGATFSVNNQGSGTGGDIDLEAGSLHLNEDAAISAETVNNTGGNIVLRLQDFLLLRQGSRISSTAGVAQSSGDGGNITINASEGFILAIPEEDSDITANAFEGRGGNINISAQALLGIEPRDELTALSDITASSELGVDGTIQINNLDLEPNQGLVELPSGLLDSSQLLTQGCGQTAVDSASQGEFFNSGRGGIVSLSSDVLGSDDVVDDLRLPTGWSDEGRVTEAQGWFVSDAGDVVLAAAPELAQGRCWR